MYALLCTKNDIEIIWQTWTEHGHWPFILIPWVCPANFSEQSAAFVNPALIVLKVRLNPNQSISESIDQRSQTDTIGLHRLCVCVCVNVWADAQARSGSLHDSAARRQHVAPQYLERRLARRKSAGIVSGMVARLREIVPAGLLDYLESLYFLPASTKPYTDTKRWS